MSNIDQFKVVRVAARSGGHLFEVRWTDCDDLEHVIATYELEFTARSVLERFVAMPYQACLYAVALESVVALLGGISLSSDDQGQATYATKSHMRAWAKEALKIISEVQDIAIGKYAKDDPTVLATLHAVGDGK
jgi:hypothetical protein